MQRIRYHKYLGRIRAAGLIVTTALFFLCACGREEIICNGFDEMTAAGDDSVSSDSGDGDASMEENSGNADITAKATEGKNLSDGENAGRSVFVYVCGAVKTPGVYELSEGSRCYEAVELAGGMTDEADSDQINLAEVLFDGQKLRIPKQGEDAGDTGISETSGEGDRSSNRVNINTAGKEALMTLPGVGEARAQAILAYREAHGKFQRTDELLKVDGIKEKIYAKLKDRIVAE